MTRKRLGRADLWSARDDAYLIRHYADRGPRWVAENVGRSVGACHRRATTLRSRGVSIARLHSRSHPPRLARAWSAADLEKGERLYAAGWTLAMIGRAVGRSPEAVGQTARSWAWIAPETIGVPELGAILGKSRGTILEWLRRGWISCRPMPQSDRRTARLITAKDVRAFLADVRNVALWRIEDIRADWREDAARLRPRYYTVTEAIAAGVGYTKTPLNNAIRRRALPAVRVRGRRGYVHAIPSEAVARLGGKP